MSRPSSSTDPELGLSNPVMTLTSVVFPAPFGPIRPTTSCRCSSRLTPSRARTPSKARVTAEARSVPGLRCSSDGGAVAVKRRRGSDLRNDLRGDRAHALRDVVLDPDHAVLAAEHRVQPGREAHQPRERRDVVEL